MVNILKDLLSMNKYKLLIIFIPLFFFTSCVTLSGPKFKALSNSNEMATVYIYRPAKLVGSAGYWKLSINHTPVVDMKNGGYYAFRVPAGETTSIFMTDPSAKGVNQLIKTVKFLPVGYEAKFILDQIYISGHNNIGQFKFQKGKTYYFRYEITGPITSSISLVDHKTGFREIKECILLEKIKA